MRCQQQWVIHVEASMLFCVFSIFTTSPSHFHSVNFSLTLYVTPARPRLNDCLICSFMLSENCAGPSVGSLFWSRVPDRKENGGLNGKRRRKQTSFISNWRQRSKDWGEPGVEEELEATGFSSASLRWESEKLTEKTHSRLQNTFYRTKGTVPGSDWCLQQ